MSNERENALDKKFHALSNQTRREILMRLNQKPHSAGEIAVAKEWLNLLSSSRKTEDI